MDLRWLSSEALVAETVPETLTKGKQGKLIINKSNWEQVNGSVWVVVNNPTEVEELITVNMLTTWKN